MAHHERVLVLHYSDADLPRFQTESEHAAWLQAVGRMVVYGMHSNEGRESQLELVTGGFTRNPWELDCHYWPRLNNSISDSLPYSENSTVKVDALVNELRQQMGKDARPFTIGAVLHSDGKWGFHS